MSQQETLEWSALLPRQKDGVLHEIVFGHKVKWYLYPFGVNVPAYTTDPEAGKLVIAYLKEQGEDVMTNELNILARQAIQTARKDWKID